MLRPTPERNMRSIITPTLIAIIRKRPRMPGQEPSIFSRRTWLIIGRKLINGMWPPSQRWWLRAVLFCLHEFGTLANGLARLLRGYEVGAFSGVAPDLPRQAGITPC